MICLHEHEYVYFQTIDDNFVFYYNHHQSFSLNAGVRLFPVRWRWVREGGRRHCMSILARQCTQVWEQWWSRLEYVVHNLIVNEEEEEEEEDEEGGVENKKKEEKVFIVVRSFD